MTMSVAFRRGASHGLRTRLFPCCATVISRGIADTASVAAAARVVDVGLKLFERIKVGVNVCFAFMSLLYQCDRTAPPKPDDRKSMEHITSMVVRPFDGERIVKSKVGKDQVFSRGADFDQLFKHANYLQVLHGPSAAGKTQYLCNLFNGQRGVVYLSLRDTFAISPFSSFVPTNLKSVMSDQDVAMCLEMGAAAYFKETGNAIVVVVDDIHTLIDHSSGKLSTPSRFFCSILLKLYITGLVNVTYSISEFVGVGCCKDSVATQHDCSLCCSLIFVMQIYKQC
jgi:hypothetical protein